MVRDQDRNLIFYQ